MTSLIHHVIVMSCVLSLPYIIIYGMASRVQCSPYTRCANSNRIQFTDNPFNLGLGNPVYRTLWFCHMLQRHRH